MKRLIKYRKSEVNQISIRYKNEDFEFSLWQELSIDEDNIEKELKTQPSYYGFLLLLQKKLNTRFEDFKRRRRKVYGKLLLRAKSQKVGSRFMNDETARAWVESHPQFDKITKLCIKAKDDADTIYAAVQGFQQRKDLLQTLSSNRRKES